MIKNQELKKLLNLKSSDNIIILSDADYNKFYDCFQYIHELINTRNNIDKDSIENIENILSMIESNIYID